MVSASQSVPFPFLLLCPVSKYGLRWELTRNAAQQNISAELAHVESLLVTFPVRIFYSS